MPPKQQPKKAGAIAPQKGVAKKAAAAGGIARILAILTSVGGLVGAYLMRKQLGFK
jgi:hypothetical protein